MKTIKLTRGKYAIVDDEDYLKLCIYKWRALHIGKNWYAVRSSKVNSKENIYMHREILLPKNDEYIDHINHDGLDNRKENLRNISNEDNLKNCTLNKNNKSGYIGVHRIGEKYWFASISYNKQKYYLGCFSNPIDAAKEYDKKAEELYGKEFKSTNKKLNLI